jgi:hypothetical protein
MNFTQRISLLIHLGGFIASLIAFPIMFAMLADGGVDMDEGLLPAILGTFLSPVLGWGLRWLITGELVSFIPFQEEVINALPTNDNYAVVLLLGFFLTFIIIYSIESADKKEYWERDVFGMQCNNDSGERNILDRYQKVDDEELGKPIYCSAYLTNNSRGENLCTWNDGANANSPECKKLEERPAPDNVEWILIILFSIFISIFSVYLLTTIQLIVNLRKKSVQT